MAEAKLNREYAIRLCCVGAIMLGLTAWSVYDGAIGWPKANADFAKVRPTLIGLSEKGLPPEAWFAVNQSNTNGTYLLKDVFDNAGASIPKHLVQELRAIPEPNESDSGFQKKRIEKAIEIFQKDIYSESKIKGQYVQAAITLVLALLAFNAVLSKRNKRFIVDDNGLSGSGFNGRSYTWDQVKSVDWSKWHDKGIITLAITNGPRFKLDGWHFAGMRPIAEVIARHFPEKEEANQ